MMTLEKILNIITEYDALWELTKEKIKILQKFDKTYNTANGIEDIIYDDKSVMYEGGSVMVTYDTSCRGCYDSDSFEFPLIWLTKTEEELKELIGDKQQKEEELKRQKEEERKRKEKEEEEKRQRELYMRLKEKFEP